MRALTFALSLLLSGCTVVTQQDATPQALLIQRHDEQLRAHEATLRQLVELEQKRQQAAQRAQAQAKPEPEAPPR